ERRSAAVHPDRHEVAADARGRAAPVRHPRGGVVRAAGAEIRLANGSDARLCEQLLLEVQKREPLAELAAELCGHAETRETAGDHARYHRRRVLIVRWKQPGTGRLAFGVAPLAVVVELADHARRPCVRLPRVEFFL